MRHRHGAVVRQRLLGTDALYRIIGLNDRGIEVEVIEAPKLAAGSRFTFAPRDVDGMELVADTDVQPGVAPHTMTQGASEGRLPSD